MNMMLVYILAGISIFLLLIIFIFILRLPQRVTGHFSKQTEGLDKKLDLFGDVFQKQGKDLREELGSQFQNFNKIQMQQYELVNKQMMQLIREVQERLERMRDDNVTQLEKIRGVVDERLNETLHKRLSQHFTSLKDLLKNASESLGEIRSLSENMVDLKKVLTGVKSRGMWGEIQLDSLLSEFLTPDVQYVKNVKVKAKSDERVEFAIKVPSKYKEQEFVLLPIDSKFPIEAYQRLISAQETADKEKVVKETKALTRIVKEQASKIAKYINPPTTTSFAIMYLPVEGLYAEVVKIPGLIEEIQRRFNVVVTGPNTFTAFVLSLQMGFRTITIQKRTQEVWRLLAMVRKDFEKFGTLLEATIKDLEKTKERLEDAMFRSKQIQRKVDRLEDIKSDVEDVDTSINELVPVNTDAS